MTNTTLTLTLSLILTAVPLVLRHFVKRKYEKLQEKLKQDEDNNYYECLFIDYKNFNCKSHLVYRQECGLFCSYSQLQKVIHYIASAKQTISMCVYMVTLKQITNELVKATKRGITVRVITDKVMGETKPAFSNILYLSQNGIICKSSHSYDDMMHHKFCLIDEKDPQKSKVFFGSVNLTAQAFCKNFESLILTNNQDIVRRLSEEFEELWNLFDNIVCLHK